MTTFTSIIDWIPLFAGFRCSVCNSKCDPVCTYVLKLLGRIWLSPDNVNCKFKDPNRQPSLLDRIVPLRAQSCSFLSSSSRLMTYMVMIDIWDDDCDNDYVLFFLPTSSSLLASISSVSRSRLLCSSISAFLADSAIISSDLKKTRPRSPWHVGPLRAPTIGP